MYDILYCTLKILFGKGWRKMEMDWYKMAVFLYVAALTHLFADFLSHKKTEGKFLFLHCFLYAIFFTPLFWWLRINFWWLLLPFFSHLIIDSLSPQLFSFVKMLLSEAGEKDNFIKIIFLGIDQILHLTVLIVIALFAF